MTPADYDAALVQRLTQHEVLRARGYTFYVGPRGGVVVDRWGHVRGIWHHDGTRFAWMPASHSQPTSWADSVDAAERFTVVMLATSTTK
ncbi:MAG: hypothetical protein KDJ37_15275 [Hyphomicrobiaceae bacterium]|nr:hypothetical protein [Hyphomicrobiaceae bacterium]